MQSLMEWGNTGNCSKIDFFVPAGTELNDRSHKDRLSDKEKEMGGYLMVKSRIFLETVLSTLTACVLQT